MSERVKSRKKIAARKRRRRHVANYVIVPKHQMRAKKPEMLIDPKKAVVVALTSDVAKAATFGTRSGAFRHVQKTKDLRGKFWYRRVA